jgi:hypothetical protein
VEEDSLGELLKALLVQLLPWAHHIWMARWQYQQFKILKTNLPQNVLLTVADFSENYRCSYQDEISSAYYSYEQVTIHPIQSYYRNEQGEVVEESVVFLSDDHVHDYLTVAECNDLLYQHLADKRGLNVEKHIQFSDGCPKQYKGKDTFHYVENMNLPTERCFFGSRHGKGPCDAIGGVLKNKASSHVRLRIGIIRNAQDMFHFACREMIIDEPTNKRVFFFITKEELEARRKKTGKVKSKRLPNTRDIHAVKNTPDGLLKRFEACFCEPCRNERYDECENVSHVGAWMPATKKSDSELKWKACNQRKKKCNVPSKLEDKGIKSKKESGPQVKKAVTRSKVSEKSKKKKLKIAKKKLYVDELSGKCSSRNEEKEGKKKRLVPKKKVTPKGNMSKEKSEEKCNVSQEAKKGNVKIGKNSVLEKTPSEQERDRPCRSSTRKITSELEVAKKKRMPINDQSSFVLPSEVQTRFTRSKTQKEEKSKTTEANSRKKKERATSPENHRTKASQPMLNTSTAKASSKKPAPGPTPPLSQRTVYSLLRALIHSPYCIQLTTALKMEIGDVKFKRDLSITSIKAAIDEKAYSLMPDDLPNSVHAHGRPSFPVTVKGDGNCLPRAGSIFAYGTESHHGDIRLRIAHELIIYKDMYLSEDHLSQGLPSNQRLSPAMVAQFSDFYTGQLMTDAAVEEIFLKEVQQILKMGEYMGLWQLFALASVMKVPIFSAYPKRGNRNIRRDMHRVLMPRETEDPNVRCPIIMWSSCRDDMSKHHWVPNHFTVILPISL